MPYAWLNHALRIWQNEWFSNHPLDASLNRVCFSFRIHPLSTLFYLHIFQDDAWYVDDKPLFPVVASVSATPGQAIAWLMGDAGALEVSGDHESLFAWHAYVMQTKTDWQALSARVFGKIIGYRLWRRAELSCAAYQRTKASFVHSVRHQMEAHWQCIPTERELLDFYDQVDALRFRYDRLAARVSELGRVVEPVS